MAKTYVLDTSVMLSDPTALSHFHEHQVVIPVVVLTELESKRHHPELGYAARVVLRHLEELRQQFGSITAAIPVNDEGGTVRVELNHQYTHTLPATIAGDTNDHRVLVVAKNLADEQRGEVILVSKDLPMRLKAAIAGLEAQEYRRDLASGDEWSGMQAMAVSSQQLDELYHHHQLKVPIDAPINTGVIAQSPTGSSALARLGADHALHLIEQDRVVAGVTARSAEQRVALDLLRDPSVGIVSLGGPAGTGKSVLALAAGLDATMGAMHTSRAGRAGRIQDRIVVFRPIYAVGGQELGFLPGAASEKMEPWADAVWDAIEAIAKPAEVPNIKAQRVVEVSPLTYIRGRSLVDTWIIIDEAQNLERSVILTALSRVGEGSKVVLTHDVAQRDNLRVGRHDGIASVVEQLKGHALFGHITLRRSERSAIAALATSVLDG